MRVFKVLMFMSFFFNSLSECFNLVGNVYKARVRVPLTQRSQNIKLTFKTKSDAELELSGLIKCVGNVYYEMCEFTDNIKFVPDNNIKKIIRKYMLSLENVSYNPIEDTANLYIRSSLIFLKQEVRFKREYCIN